MVETRRDWFKWVSVNEKIATFSSLEIKKHSKNLTFWIIHFSLLLTHKTTFGPGNSKHKIQVLSVPESIEPL